MSILFIFVMSAVFVPSSYAALTSYERCASSAEDEFWQPYVANNTAASYTGKWGSGPTNDPNMYNGDQHASNTRGSTATFTFFGGNNGLVGAAYGYRKASNAGRAEVFIDGILVRTVDLYSPNRVQCHLAFEVPGQGFSNHTITVKVAGSSFVSVDWFGYFQ
jgi:hypothetical protein